MGHAIMTFTTKVTRTQTRLKSTCKVVFFTIIKRGLVNRIQFVAIVVVTVLCGVCLPVWRKFYKLHKIALYWIWKHEGCSSL